MLKILVRRVMAVSPKCFRCIFDMLSGPVAGEFLRFFMAFFVSLIVNLGVLF